MADTYAMVNLVEQGWATQREVARAFGCSPRSIRRHQARFHTGGLAALGRAGGYPAGRRRVSRSREHLVGRLKTQGVATREIARRLGVTPKAVRKVLTRLGWREPEPDQLSLPVSPSGGDPTLSAFPSTALADGPAWSGSCGGASAIQASEAEPLPRSVDRDPADRRGDRLLAYLGLLEDAAPACCAPCRPSWTVASSPSPGTSTGASGPPSTGCARRGSPSC